MPNAAAMASVMNTRFMIPSPLFQVYSIGAKEWAAASATAAEWTVPNWPSEILHHSPTADISERLDRQVKGLTVRTGDAVMPHPCKDARMAKTTDNKDLKPDTRLVVAGRNSSENHGFVNPPVIHASTVLYPNAADMVAHRARYQYGRRGTPTSEALEGALQAIEGPGCAGVSLVPSGAAAVSTALVSVVKAGDHILITDSVYRPTRLFADTILKKLGVETTYYDPLICGDVAKLMRPNTRAVFVETPGSQSFEMQDVPAIARAAHERNAVVL